jgi:predicted esterase
MCLWILKEMGATVTEKVYNNMGHTIIEDEINHANLILAANSEQVTVNNEQ